MITSLTDWSQLPQFFPVTKARNCVIVNQAFLVKLLFVAFHLECRKEIKNTFAKTLITQILLIFHNKIEILLSDRLYYNYINKYQKK